MLNYRSSYYKNIWAYENQEENIVKKITLICFSYRYEKSSETKV